MVTTTVHFPKLHAAQREIKDHRARFKVVATGRHFGKTRLGLLMCLETALAGGSTWWVWLTYKSLRPAWRDLSRIARQIGGARIQESDLLVTFPNGGEVMARTAEDPVNLRGEGLDGGVIDEAAHLKQGVWDGSIRPSLMDRAGWGDPDLEPRRHELVPRPLATRPAGSRPPKTFAFLEREPDPRLDEEPSLKEFLRNTALNSDATEDEIEFLKHPRFKGKRPTPLYYYRELQNLRDPLHFRTAQPTVRCPVERCDELWGRDEPRWTPKTGHRWTPENRP